MERTGVAGSGGVKQVRAGKQESRGGGCGGGWKRCPWRSSQPSLSLSGLERALLYRRG